jgi:hypothetical protein
MCTKHLLGEHVEHHMFIGAINKGISVQGYIDRGFLEIPNLHARHDELVKEMERRGMKHSSPLGPILVTYKGTHTGHINTEFSLAELVRRCKLCRERALDYI